MTKCYSELISLPTFEERVEYLRTRSHIGGETFGFHRYLNQMLYRNQQWRAIRNNVILRDDGCDLACADRLLGNEPAVVHHIIPITIEMIEARDPLIFDLENLITTTPLTHNVIHYGTDESVLSLSNFERKPNDTIPWRK